MTFEVFQRPQKRYTRPHPPPSTRDRAIRAAFREGVSRTELAALFGLAYSTIYRIIADEEPSIG